MKKKLKILFFVILILSVSVFIIYFKFFMNAELVKENKTKKMEYENYQILEGSKGYIKEFDNSYMVEGFDNSPKAYYIEGTLISKNATSFLLITFDLYDENDQVMTQAIAGINDVEIDKEYKFLAMSLTGKDIDKVKYYKINSIKEI